MKMVQSKWFVIFLFLLFFVVIGFFVNRSSQHASPLTISPSPTEQIPPAAQNELSRGWYWGSETQKKPGTPDSWVFSEAGRSSCWHEPAVACQW